LVYPVRPAPRTAVLEPWFGSEWFRSHSAIRIFNQGWCPEAAAFRPESIAATWARLEALLTVEMESLTHAVIVLARPSGDLLTAEQRERLWRALRVPVFEQIIGARGALLAAECEAHAGLHIESAKYDPGSRPIETAPCGCGRTAPRLKPVEPIEETRAAAAYAG
jgi:hypothetical protein